MKTEQRMGTSKIIGYKCATLIFCNIRLYNKVHEVLIKVSKNKVQFNKDIKTRVVGMKNGLWLIKNFKVL